MDSVEAIVEHYQPRLIHYFFGHVNHWEDAKDLSQETLIRVSRSLEMLRESEALNAWIYTIAHRVLISFYRQKKQKFLPLEVVDQSDTPFIRMDDSPSFEEQLLLKETQQEVMSTVRELPEKFRTAFLLREISQLSYQEIGDILHCRIGTVQSRIFRARNLLMKRLKQKGVEL